MGTVVVSGMTGNGNALAGNQSAGGADAFVRQYDATGRQVWTQQFGTAGQDLAVGVAIDGTGRIWVVGSTERALPGQLWAGSIDAFVREYDAVGTEVWTHQFGTDTPDVAFGVAVDRAGEAYVVGSTERGRSAGGSDGYVRRYDSSGRNVWTWQFGTGEPDIALAVAVDSAGRCHTVGSTRGALRGQTSTGSRDAFLIQLAHE